MTMAHPPTRTHAHRNLFVCVRVRENVSVVMVCVHLCVSFWGAWCSSKTVVVLT